MAEYRRQILAGGVIAVVLAISIGIAVLYVPTLNLSKSSSSTSSFVSSTSSSNVTSSSAPVTIYLSSTLTSSSSSNATDKSPSVRSHQTTVTVTVTDNGSITTVYRNGTATVYENHTQTETLTEAQTVTVTSGSQSGGPSTTSISPGNGSCPNYEGSIAPLYCIPIIIANDQPSPVATGTQIMMQVNWESYSTYLAQNVGNVLFADSSGNPLYSWCESNCSNVQSSSNVWIRDDDAIPSFGQQQIFLYIFRVSQIQYNTTGYWGAYPTLTPTYGQYDNGPKVFDFYNNFNGTSLCTCLAAVPFLGGLYPGGTANYSVSNGLTIAATGAPSGAGYGYHIYLNTPESFTAVDSSVAATDLPTSVNLEAAYRYNAMDLVPPATSYLDNGFYSSYSSLDFLCGCGNSLSVHLDQGSGENGSTVVDGNFQPWTGVQSFVWTATGSQYVNYMETQQLRGSDSTVTLAPAYADITFVTGLPSQYFMTFQWMRTRNAPPNDTMPSASFGSLLSYDLPD